MAAIRHKNTKPEIFVRKALWERGLRGYRLHDKSLPGQPDIRFTRYNAVIFVHGCYWHRHQGCSKTTSPRTNADFWKTKLNRNAERDRAHVLALRELGWRVAIVWECALHKKHREQIQPIEKLANWLAGDNDRIVIPSNPPEPKPD